LEKDVLAMLKLHVIMLIKYPRKLNIVSIVN